MRMNIGIIIRITSVLGSLFICTAFIQHHIKTVKNYADRQDSIKTSDLLSLDSIRSTLIRQEETIIFALIERAQYRRNYDIYDPKQITLADVYGAPLSFLEWMLIETEKLHAKVRRYTSPEEHAFYEDRLPPPILGEIEYPKLIPVNKSDVQVNTEIMRWYTGRIVDRLCYPGDDEQHGSAVLCDIAALQALSRRIHMGKFVAESKFLKDSETYTSLLKKGDVLGVLELLTNREVERGVLRRAFLKASTYGQDIKSTAPVASNASSNSTSNSGVAATSSVVGGRKVDPMLIADLYRDMIIPLTKDVEVRYLFHRVGLTPPPPESYYSHCRAPLDAFDDFETHKDDLMDIHRPMPKWS